ncbi:hypothetical protein LUZ60_011742 [Juncus effusus]|nr:hypothetical protein LUZ60_011742 [Juncus effusus]
MKLRRKRVRTSPVSTTPKRRRNGEPELERINLIESLSQDVLIKVLCKVDHSDLKSVLMVSKSFYQATLVAREIHHSYNTPVKPASERLKNLENDDKSLM